MSLEIHLIIVSLAFLCTSNALPREASDAVRTPHPSLRALCKHVLKGELFNRTELFFGTARAEGVVSPEEFARFIDAEVTPRFPAGLTVLDGRGQYQGADGKIIQEGSKILILFYRFTTEQDAAIEAIRSRYKALFAQESVLRADAPACVKQ